METLINVVIIVILIFFIFKIIDALFAIYMFCYNKISGYLFSKRKNQLATIVICKTQNGSYNMLIATTKVKSVFNLVDKHNSNIPQTVFSQYELFCDTKEQVNKMILDFYDGKVPEQPQLSWTDWDEILAQNAYQVNFTNNVIVSNYHDEYGKKTKVQPNTEEGLRNILDSFTFKPLNDKAVGFLKRQGETNATL